KDPSSGEIVTADTIRFPSPLQHLHALLLESHRVVPLRRYQEDLLDIHTPDVLARIRAGDPSWRSSVPPPIVEIIQRRSLFGAPSAGMGRGAAEEKQMRRGLRQWWAPHAEAIPRSRPARGTARAPAPGRRGAGPTVP